MRSRPLLERYGRTSLVVNPAAQTSRGDLPRAAQGLQRGLAGPSTREPRDRPSVRLLGPRIGRRVVPDALLLEIEDLTRAHRNPWRTVSPAFEYSGSCSRGGGPITLGSSSAGWRVSLWASCTTTHPEGPEGASQLLMTRRRDLEKAEKRTRIDLGLARIPEGSRRRLPRAVLHAAWTSSHYSCARASRRARRFHVRSNAKALFQYVKLMLLSNGQVTRGEVKTRHRYDLQPPHASAATLDGFSRRHRDLSS